MIARLLPPVAGCQCAGGFNKAIKFLMKSLNILTTTSTMATEIEITPRKWAFHHALPLIEKTPIAATSMATIEAAPASPTAVSLASPTAAATRRDAVKLVKLSGRVS